MGEAGDDNGGTNIRFGAFIGGLRPPGRPSEQVGAASNGPHSSECSVTLNNPDRSRSSATIFETAKARIPPPQRVSGATSCLASLASDGALTFALLSWRFSKKKD